MARRKKRIHSNPPRHAPDVPSKLILLDQFSLDDLHQWTTLKDKFLRYHWDFYNEIAYQRARVIDEIKKSLIGACEKDYQFDNWQRALKYRYALEPFSVTGSLVDPAGGRFNIGAINPAQFPSFPALYIANDKQTAYQELLCQAIDPVQEDRSFNFALTDRTSCVNVSLSGHLSSIIDLRNPQKLQAFINLIKDFAIPDSLRRSAKAIGEKEPELIRTVEKLTDSLLDARWRLMPMQFDVPSPSQIFGQLVEQSGIEGILYPSKFNGQDCLAIFPQNFEATDSFIQLDDPAPSEIKAKRLDAAVWKAYNNDRGGNE